VRKKREEEERETMLHSRGHRKSACFSVLIGAIQYDLAPYLNRRGADVWIDELENNSVTLGFACQKPGERVELWDWLTERLRCLIRPGTHLCSLMEAGTITLKAGPTALPVASSRQAWALAAAGM
jgi:hypothetical protein